MNLKTTYYTPDIPPLVRKIWNTQTFLSIIPAADLLIEDFRAPRSVQLAECEYKWASYAMMVFREYEACLYYCINQYNQERRSFPYTLPQVFQQVKQCIEDYKLLLKLMLGVYENI